MRNTRWVCQGACSPRKFLYFQTVLDRFWWYFDLYFTFSEDYTEYQFRSQDSMVSAALPPCIAGMPHVKMPHLFICHARVTNVPRIIGTSVRDPYILVRPSPASYTTYRDRTRFFLLRDLVLAMVCVKKNFPLVYSSLRRAHATVTRSRHGDRHHGYKHDRLEGIFNYRLLPRKVVR